MRFHSVFPHIRLQNTFLMSIWIPTVRVKELIAALAQKENFLRTDRAEEDFRYVDLSKKK